MSLGQGPSNSNQPLPPRGPSPKEVKESDDFCRLMDSYAGMNPENPLFSNFLKFLKKSLPEVITPKNLVQTISNILEDQSVILQLAGLGKSEAEACILLKAAKQLPPELEKSVEAGKSLVESMLNIEIGFFLTKTSPSPEWKAALPPIGVNAASQVELAISFDPKAHAELCLQLRNLIGDRLQKAGCLGSPLRSVLYPEKWGYGQIARNGGIALVLENGIGGTQINLSTPWGEHNVGTAQLTREQTLKFLEDIVKLNPIASMQDQTSGLLGMFFGANAQRFSIVGLSDGQSLPEARFLQQHESVPAEKAQLEWSKLTADLGINMNHSPEEISILKEFLEAFPEIHNDNKFEVFSVIKGEFGTELAKYALPFLNKWPAEDADYIIRYLDNNINDAFVLEAMRKHSDELAQFANDKLDSGRYSNRGSDVVAGLIRSIAPHAAEKFVPFLVKAASSCQDPQFELEAIGKFGKAANTPEVLSLLERFISEGGQWSKHYATQSLADVKR